VSFLEILSVLFICLVIEGVFQACWDGIAAVRPNLDKHIDLSARTFTIYCGGNRWMWLGSVLVRVGLLIISAIVAYLSRGLRKEQNYSKETALAIYTTAIILVVAIPIGFAVTQSPVLVVFLKGIAICLGIMATIIITFFDPVFRIFTGKDPREFKSTVSRMSGTGNSAQMSGGVGTSVNARSY